MAERRLLELVSVTEGAWNPNLAQISIGVKRTFVGLQDVRDSAQPCKARRLRQISTFWMSCCCVASQRRVRRRMRGGDDAERRLPVFGPEANFTVLDATLGTVG